MEPHSLDSKHSLHSVPVYLAPGPDKGGAIDITALWQVLVKRKWVFIVTLLAAMILGFSYLSLAQPLYRAEVHLLPPQQRDIQGLLLDFGDAVDISFKSYTPESVYEKFLRNLRSKGLRYEFYTTHHLAEGYLSSAPAGETDSHEVFDGRFDKNLRVQINKNEPSFAVVSFLHPDGILAARLLNEFVEVVDLRTVENLYGDFTAAVQAKEKLLRVKRVLGKIVFEHGAVHIQKKTTLGVAEYCKIMELIKKLVPLDHGKCHKTLNECIHRTQECTQRV